MKRYNSYHTKIKTCYSLGLQETLLPKEFITSIPRSTTQGWKDLNPETFIGYEFAHQVETDLEQVKLILDERVKPMKTCFMRFVDYTLLFSTLWIKRSLRNSFCRTKKQLSVLLTIYPLILIKR